MISLRRAPEKRPPQPRDRRGTQKLGQHQPQRVEDAHAEEDKPERQLHATVVAHHVIHAQPCLHIDDAVIVFARKSAVLAFLVRVVVHENLVAVPIRRGSETPPNTAARPRNPV